MTNKPLSDEEIEDITALCSQQSFHGLVTYVNRLLGNRSKGLDSCARPLSFRQDDECGGTCFALGYLKKVKEFTEQLDMRVRCGDGSELEDISNYIDALVKEIDIFFK